MVSALKLTPSSTGESDPTSSTAGVAVLGQIVQGQANNVDVLPRANRAANKNLIFIVILQNA